MSLGTMLSVINCLVSLTCYYKLMPQVLTAVAGTNAGCSTGYDARCNASLYPNMTLPQAHLYDPQCTWKDVKVQGTFHSDYCSTTVPDFAKQSDPVSFFRPGQVFSAQIGSNLSLTNMRQFRDVDFCALPLKPISELKATAEREQLEDRAERLAQIRRLPLQQMAHYCRDSQLNNKNIQCLLCPNNGRNSYTRDSWASEHFRLYHWRQYFGMVPSINISQVERNKGENVIPWDEQEKKFTKLSSSSHFSVDDWIVFDDVVLDIPILTNVEIVRRLEQTSQLVHHKTGPIMIQRFIVVREGERYCLCVGIHTYASHIPPSQDYSPTNLAKVRTIRLWEPAGSRTLQRHKFREEPSADEAGRSRGCLAANTYETGASVHYAAKHRKGSFWSSLRDRT
jgi:hypothetical protein